MDTLFHQTGLMVAACQAENHPGQRTEERTGRLTVRRPLRDRLRLQAGQLMVTMGEKLAAHGTENNQPSQEPA
jgi:hypothetical protein